MKSAMSNSAVIATRFSGAVPSRTRPVVPLKTAPAPAPIRPPLTRNSARLGVERRTAVTRSTRPTSIEAVPSANTRDARSPAVASCDSTPAVKTMKSVAPARACEVLWKVLTRISPDSPAKRPLAAKAARVAAPAGAGSLTENGARAAAGAPVSGAAARPTNATAASAIQTRYGSVSGWLAQAARLPATRGPIPSPPTFTDVPIVRASSGEAFGSARRRSSMR